MYEKIFTDSKLTEFFKKTDKERQKKMQFDFLSRAFGGPNNYTGKSMIDSHKGRGITHEHFNLVAGHVIKTMNELKVPQPLVQEVV